MKKLILTVLACASVLMAGAPSADQFVYQWDIDTVFNSTANSDTLTAANDSITLATNYRVHSGYQYFVALDSITGDGADSVDIDIILEMNDCEGNMIIRKAPLATLTVDEGQQAELTVGEIYLGCRMNLKLIAGADIGGEVIINRSYLLKRRPIVWNKKY